MITKENSIRFAHGEFASYSAAISVLAERLAEATETVLNKQDREALARAMLRCSSGRVEDIFGAVEWSRDEATKDLLYAIV